MQANSAEAQEELERQAQVMAEKAEGSAKPDFHDSGLSKTTPPPASCVL